mgnify:CR=1 FL=1
MEQVTNNGSNVLHLACRYGTPEIITVVLASLPESYLNQTDEHDNSPLHYLNKRLDKETPEIQGLLNTFQEKEAEDISNENQESARFA